MLVAATPHTRLLDTLENSHYCNEAFERSRLLEGPDDLLRELAGKESDLCDWLSSSDKNRQWFAADPVGAIRAAELGIDEHLLQQLEVTTRSIARKLRRLQD